MFSARQIFSPLPIMKTSQSSHQSLNMDIQIFTNFTLAPEMGIQIADKFALLPIPERSADITSKKRTAEDALSDQSLFKKRRTNDDGNRQGVKPPMIVCGWFGCARITGLETTGGNQRSKEGTRSITRSEQRPGLEQYLSVDERVRVARYAEYKKKLWTENSRGCSCFR
jgi:hypothetical protein